MPLTAKDIIHIISLAVVIAGFLYKIRKLESDCEQVKRTLYHKQGGLNVITCQQCTEHRDSVFSAIRKGEKIAETQTKELRLLNENVLRIMIHLKIDPRGPLV